MTDLSKLTVSLTKHGAHKISQLLRHFDATDILAKTGGQGLNISIKKSQAKKILSVDNAGKVPVVWSEAKKEGPETIDGLVLMAIIFSHHTLIEAMSEATTGPGIGAIERCKTIDGKSFTNFKNDLIELRVARSADANTVRYDLSHITENGRLGSLTGELLKLKLKSVGWDGAGTIAEESVKQNLHAALGLTEDDFRDWLSGMWSDAGQEEQEGQEDSEEQEVQDFIFAPGHQSRKAGRSKKPRQAERAEARLLHNELQQILYQRLVEDHGAANVATEHPAGVQRTAIDIAVKLDKNQHIFYEIKTNSSARICVREAIGQLLEYSYWVDTERAQQLIIVGPQPPNDEISTYIKSIRERTRLPLYYQSIDEKTRVLSKLV